MTRRPSEEGTSGAINRKIKPMLLSKRHDATIEFEIAFALTGSPRQSGY
jgi:hypothetical protein